MSRTHIFDSEGELLKNRGLSYFVTVILLESQVLFNMSILVAKSQR